MSLTTTPISRAEQITAIKSMADEHESVSSITTTMTHIIVTMSDTSEAAALVTQYRNSGWWSATNGSNLAGTKWFVRVPINVM